MMKRLIASMARPRKSKRYVSPSPPPRGQSEGRLALERHVVTRGIEIVVNLEHHVGGKPLGERLPDLGRGRARGCELHGREHGRVYEAVVRRVGEVEPRALPDLPAHLVEVERVPCRHVQPWLLRGRAIPFGQLHELVGHALELPRPVLGLVAALVLSAH